MTGRSFERRRQWVEGRIHELAGIFGVAIRGYALMSNDLHVVVQVIPQTAANWPVNELTVRWSRLFQRRDQDAGKRSEVLAGNEMESKRCEQNRIGVWFRAYLVTRSTDSPVQHPWV